MASTLQQRGQRMWVFSSLLFKTSTERLLFLSRVGCGMLNPGACFRAAEDPAGAWGSRSSAPLRAGARTTIPDARSTAC